MDYQNRSWEGRLRPLQGEDRLSFGGSFFYQKGLDAERRKNWESAAEYYYKAKILWWESVGYEHANLASAVVIEAADHAMTKYLEACRQRDREVGHRAIHNFLLDAERVAAARARTTSVVELVFDDQVVARVNLP